MTSMFEIDYHGQRFVEDAGQAIVGAGVAAGLVVGWIRNSLQAALYVWLAFLAVALVVCVPPWPFLRRHPIKWRSVPDSDDSDSEDDSEEEKPAEPAKSSKSTKAAK